MSATPTNQDAKLTRKQASDALKENDYPIESATLATMATRGGGPPFQKFGARGAVGAMCLPGRNPD